MNQSTPQSSSRPRGLRLAAAIAGLTAVGLLGGCSDAEAGTLIGAGLGALAGQAIGGDTGATVVGTAVGGAVGYGLGNESDKRKSQDQYRRYNDY